MRSSSVPGMGSIGILLQVSGDGDRAALHSAIWDAAQDFIGMYVNTRSPAYGSLSYYLGDAMHEEKRAGTWGPDGDQLQWWFRDFAGCCSRSAGAWLHWLQLAFAADWDRFTQLADEHGLTITSTPPALATLLGAKNYVLLRDELWSAEENGLFGDDEHVPIDDLTDEERALHAQALERCLCWMCTLLRPEPEHLTPLMSGLDNAGTVSSAAWYLSRTHDTSPQVLEALVRAGGSGMRALVPDVERYAPRVPDAWPTLVALLPSLRSGARGLALYALAAADHDSSDRVVLIRELRAALTGSGEDAEAAAELIGRVGRGVPELPEELAAVLDREVSAELRHQVVLGLVNLHLPPNPPPTPAIRSRLEHEAEQDTEAARLAKWLLTAF